MRTIVFSMFSIHPTSQSRSHFPPKPLRTQPPNHNVDFHIQNHEIVSKLSPKCVPKDSQNSSETATNPCLGPAASQEVSPLVPGPAQWIRRVLKWSLRVLKITVLSKTPTPLQQSASQQAPVLNQALLLTSCLGGRRQGRSLKMYIYIYIYICLVG